MTKAKGLALLISTAALVSACSIPALASPTQPDPAFPDVREQILQLLQERALYRDRIDWPAVRQQFQAAKGTPEADVIVDKTIAGSTGNHGRWIRASTVAKASNPQAATRARAPQRAGAGKDASNSTPNPDRTNDPIGWISIPRFMDFSRPDGAARYHRRLAFARQLQSQLRTEDKHDRCGWIVDLRQNSGGNMWPMLVGVFPLLSTDPKHREVIGAFNAGETHQLWSLDSGLVLLDERAPVALDTPNYVLRHPAPPVAVLIGPKTGSSGEAVALAFRDRPVTRSFGQETAGFSTANRQTPLQDGSVLLLTGSVSVDRNLKGDGGKLKPDVTTGDDAGTVASARTWLLEQPACRKAG